MKFLDKVTAAADYKFTTERVRTIIIRQNDSVELNDVVLVWGIEMDTRSWGVKNVVPVVVQQQISGHDAEGEVHMVNVTGAKIKWSKDDLEPKYLTIQPVLLEINEKKKTTEVTFSA